MSMYGRKPTEFTRIKAVSVAPIAQEFTASGAAKEGASAIELNHATVIAAVTLTPAQGLLVVKDTSASGTAAHTLTLNGTATFDGTNNTATLNAPLEQLAVFIDSAGQGTIITNTGTVALSSV